MASIKVKFRPSTVAGQEGSICYQVIHDRIPRQIASSYKVLPHEWDSTRNNVVTKRDSERRVRVQSIREHIRCDVERLTKIIRRLEDRGLSYTTDDICDEFYQYAEDLSLANFVKKEVIRLKQNGKHTTAGHYRSMLNSVKRFLLSLDDKDDDIFLDNISSQWLIDYEAWLMNTGISRNTSSFYMRILRSIYNHAVENDMIEQRNPFKRVYTGIDKTTKRAIPLKAITTIRQLDLSGDVRMDFARDMFMLAFYFRGMSFVDMAFLKKTDLQNGMVVYHRRKTGQKLAIKWKPEMQSILDKYRENDSDYLLPIIRHKGLNERCAYRNAADKVNRYLKKIAVLAGVKIKLTHYVARHSWASAAQSKNVPLRVISEGMGHDSETTTQIYLASLDTSAVDRANDDIINSL